MIRNFRHKGLKKFFESESKQGIQPAHAPKLSRQLTALNQAEQPEDMNTPGWRLHGLEADLVGHYSVWVSGNWRLTFAFDDGDNVLVDYRDYH